MTARAQIRQADLERIFKAAKAADVRVRVEIEPRGKVVILPLGPADDSGGTSNPWEDDDA